MYSDKEWRWALGRAKNKPENGNRWSDEKKMKWPELLYLA
jgi:hypothetical protein